MSTMTSDTMTSNRMTSDMIKFLTMVGKLKRTKRSGWVMRGVNDPESVSDHMYSCIKLCLIHDMAECIVGDITPYDNVSKEEKHAREKKAMQELSSLLPDEAATEIMELFEEYESQSTEEARYVKDLDRFEMILQARHYEEGEGMCLQEFYDSVDGKIKNQEIISLATTLVESRRK
uniref:HD domain-containing protein 2-like isoform X2 n=1 Tax=Ciona intestinalis TaxID=7719 RepID=UPI000EF49CCE|nr:HD domain-containing protein 2-like isoform X2 [Ciona intestinalis]|eukprot:XP_026693844.1 HD domain-containing protein 2-like isoform X2 [Ciona intestinalis]